MARRAAAPRAKRSLSAQPILSLRHAMDRLFDDWFTGRELAPLELWKETPKIFSPKVDLAESDKDYLITAEMPGLEQRDIKISVTQDSITLQGEKKEEKEEKKKNFYRRERSFGSFFRDIPLSTEIDKNKVRATFKNGVLKVTLPKKKGTKPAAKSVSIKAS